MVRVWPYPGPFVISIVRPLCLRLCCPELTPQPGLCRTRCPGAGRAWGGWAARSRPATEDLEARHSHAGQVRNAGRPDALDPLNRTEPRILGHEALLVDVVGDVVVGSNKGGRRGGRGSASGRSDVEEVQRRRVAHCVVTVAEVPDDVELAVGLIERRVSDDCLMRRACRASRLDLVQPHGLPIQVHLRNEARASTVRVSDASNVMSGLSCSSACRSGRRRRRYRQRPAHQRRQQMLALNRHLRLHRPDQVDLALVLVDSHRRHLHAPCRSARPRMHAPHSIMRAVQEPAAVLRDARDSRRRLVLPRCLLVVHPDSIRRELGSRRRFNRDGERERVVIGPRLGRHAQQRVLLGWRKHTVVARLARATAVLACLHAVQTVEPHSRQRRHAMCRSGRACLPARHLHGRPPGRERASGAVGDRDGREVEGRVARAAVCDRHACDLPGWLQQTSNWTQRQTVRA
eukprot:1067553-Rhodomonas_salina.2